MAVKKKIILLPRIEPNISLIRQYRQALKPLVDAMAHSVEYWIKNPFEAAEDVIAPTAPETNGIKDASPAARIQKTLNKIKRNILARRAKPKSSFLSQFKKT